MSDLSDRLFIQNSDDDEYYEESPIHANKGMMQSKRPGLRSNLTVKPPFRHGSVQATQKQIVSHSNNSSSTSNVAKRLTCTAQTTK